MMITTWASPLDVIRESFGATQISFRDITEQDLATGRVHQIYSANIYGPDTEVVRHFESSDSRREWILKAGVQGDSSRPLSTVGRLFPFSLPLNRAHEQDVLVLVNKSQTTAGERGQLLGFSPDRFGEPCIVIRSESGEEKQIQLITAIGAVEWKSRPTDEWSSMSRWMKEHPYWEEALG